MITEFKMIKNILLYILFISISISINANVNHKKDNSFEDEKTEAIALDFLLSIIATIIFFRMLLS